MNARAPFSVPKSRAPGAIAAAAVLLLPLLAAVVAQEYGVCKSFGDLVEGLPDTSFTAIPVSSRPEFANRDCSDSWFAYESRSEWKVDLLKSYKLSHVVAYASGLATLWTSTTGSSWEKHGVLLAGEALDVAWVGPYMLNGTSARYIRLQWDLPLPIDARVQKLSAFEYIPVTPKGSHACNSTNAYCTSQSG
eukprot:TRINITY_DN20550_c0_g1_i1.p1 TRINITY_DN20550_c0_g1~~TRINITY_DN20550_c0_g1_i1.p1  ORF type:complete len:192 (+),score=21.76 TRINITY_DN20550_c0_g1_i1:58-633(+)